MKKIGRYIDWGSMPYKEKSLYDEFQHITLISNNAGIPKMIVEVACQYYKKITDQQSFRGLNRDGIIAASIYIACRIHNYPRTPKEIARIFQLDSTSATRGCKNAMTIINFLEKSIPQEEQTKYATTDPHSFIERYCSKLSVPTKYTKLAQFIAIQIQKINLITENTPYSIEAGIIYIISQEIQLSITKKEIQLISDTSEVTINKCYRKIDTLKKELIPSSFTVM
jgi:transcription initiation factor TFIIB